MNKVKLIIDNCNIEVESGITIVEAAKVAGIRVPTLCWLKGISCPTSCRVCMVEIEGINKLVTACNTPVREGIVVRTSTAKVLNARKTNIELQLSDHSKSCLSCSKNLKCELQRLAREYDCDGLAITGEESCTECDDSHPCIVKDLSKCIQCGRCVAVCKTVQGVSAITKIRRGFHAKVSCAHDMEMRDSQCVGCGQCTLVCPTGALMEKSDVGKAIEFISDPNLIVTAQIAPAVRVALAEEFGAELGHFSETKIATALKMIGFKHVFDVNAGADFTVIEEGIELIERIKANKGLPLFSSCCPAWFNFVEEFYPEYLPNVSTCKSPTQMLGSLIKSYYAHHKRYDAKNIRVVDIMPCTAKKGERLRGDDVDVCLTTRELAMLLRKKGIDFNKIPDGEFDSPLGEYSGAALIFGVSGGVCEAVLRTAVKKITGKDAENLDFNVVRDSQGIKETDVTVGDLTLKIAIVNGLLNARKVLEDIKHGRKNYTFVEVMACPGGCVNGGGQPYCDKNFVSVSDIVKARGGSLYKRDKELSKDTSRRVSHENKHMLDIYTNYLDKNKGLAHVLFHRGEH